MASAAVLTAPPPAPSRRSRRQDSEANGPADDAHASLATRYSSVWFNDCSGVQREADDSLHLDCFTSEISVQGLPFPSTFSDPQATFLTLLQTQTSTEPASTSTEPRIGLNSSTGMLDRPPMETESPTNPPQASSSSPNVGAIAGGVVGGVVLLALLVGLLLFLRRRRRTHTAPSAEFMHIARRGSGSSSSSGGGGGSPALSAKRASQGTMRSLSLSSMPLALARQGSLSLDDDERPPPFTPGNYRDPVYEKVLASAALREEYAARDVEGGYKD
ncbi:hypothetical protein C8Q76DRAFT_98019 [Earliella scabrosa]|nr:hypothetical protein C8Q76DRAFT_98019 [Earliella scabrosa]